MKKLVLLIAVAALLGGCKRHPHHPSTPPGGSTHTSIKAPEIDTAGAAIPIAVLSIILLLVHERRRK